MNLRREIRRTKRKLRKWWRTTHRRREITIYARFVLIVTVICIIAPQFLSGSKLRTWIEKVTHKDLINKDIQYKVDGNDEGTVAAGTFLTHYRKMKFGATDPEDIDPNAPMIAFTFDDGPNSEYTQRILNVLAENYSHATFFVVGYNIEKYPDMIKAISLAGCELGNHTNDHKNLTLLDSDEAENQIGKVNRAVKKLTGSKTTMIRPPEGAYNESVLSLLEEPVVLWNLDTEDWSSRNAQVIAQRILDSAQDGDIVLMHDIYDSTAEAVEIVVPMLKERGFQIMSVGEMARYKGKELELGKAYGKIVVEKEESNTEEEE
ncbi:MAG: polysaccharide deacetylase family protein [Eubacteriales bacterium]|nr:polysaccharide deacetylase family protein [Eubacteriales bacterium]